MFSYFNNRILTLFKYIKYDLDLKIFYNPLPEIENIIKEIPMYKINLVIDKAGVIIANSKVNKSYIFDILDICKFIDNTTELIIAALKEIEYI